MKKLPAFGLWLLLILFSSCVMQSRIIIDDNEGKSGQTMHLTQQIKAKTANKANGQTTGIRFVAQYCFSPDATGKQDITMNIFLSPPAALDYLFIWKLDGEPFGFKTNDSGIVPEKSISTSRLLQIPQNLWISIANADSISFELKSEQSDYKINLPERFKKRLKYFFELAMDETAKTRPVPEGKMKW